MKPTGTGNSAGSYNRSISRILNQSYTGTVLPTGRIVGYGNTGTGLLCEHVYVCCLVGLLASQL